MWMILGASGFLGAYLIKNIQAVSKEPVLAISRNIPQGNNGGVKWLSADVTKDSGIAVIREASLHADRNKVIYLAAYHKPDLVQINPRYAWDTNITALSKILNVLENVDCFFYSSTDSVYGESEDRYHFKEDDVCRPKNQYGIQKKTAEALVIGYGYQVARFPFLIGRSLASHKKHFCDEILDAFAKGNSYKMFDDSYRSALDFDTASRCLVEIMQKHQKECPSVINISGDDDLSKYDIGRMLAQQYGYPENLVVPVSVCKDKDIFKAPRATSTLMDNTLLKRLLKIEVVKLSFV